MGRLFRQLRRRSMVLAWKNELRYCLSLMGERMSLAMARRTSSMPTADPASCSTQNMDSASWLRTNRLTFGPFTVQKVMPGSDFYIRSWAG